MAALIAPMCGMNIFEVMWQLPVTVAYQIFYVYLQIQGCKITTAPNEAELLRRFKRWQRTK